MKLLGTCKTLSDSLAKSEVNLCKSYWGRIRGHCQSIALVLTEIEKEDRMVELETLLVCLGRLKALKSFLSKENFVNFTFSSLDDLGNLEARLKQSCFEVVVNSGLYRHVNTFNLNPVHFYEDDEQEWIFCMKDKEALLKRLNYANDLTRVPRLKEIFAKTEPISDEDVQAIWTISKELSSTLPENTLIQSLSTSEDPSAVKAVVFEYQRTVDVTGILSPSTQDVDVITLTSTEPYKVEGAGDVEFKKSELEKEEIILKKVDANLDASQLREEVHALRLLTHRANVVNFMGVYVQENTKYFAIKYFGGGTLYSFLRENAKQLIHEAKLEMAIGIANGLSVLHQLNLLHGNLCSLNVLVHDDLTVAITGFDVMSEDFKTLCNFSHVKTQDVLSTYWKAPELLKEEESTGKTKTADIYALGVILWEIFTGLIPFKEEKDEATLRQWILEGKKPGDYTGQVSIKKVIESCWESSVNQRPTAEQLVAQLKGLRLIISVFVTMAARDNDEEFVSLLLDNGVDPISKDFDDDGMGAVHLAVKGHHASLLRLLLSRQKNLMNSLQYNGWSPLHYAAKLGFTELVELLLENDADFTLRDKEKNSIVHLAAENGRVDVIKLLMKKKVGMLNEKNDKENTPLHLASEMGHIRVVKKLVYHGTDLEELNLEQKTAYTAAMEALRFNVGFWLEGRRTKEYSRILGEWTFPHIFAEEGEVYVMQQLISRLPDLDIKTKTGITPLHAAVANGRVDVAAMLLHSGADVNCVTVDDWTPAHVVASCGPLEMLQLLVRYKANIFEKDRLQRSPLHVAARCGQVDLVKYLASMSSANPNEPDFKGRTPLHLAVKGGHLDVVKWLVESQKIDINALNSEKSTALHSAVKGGHFEIVEYFLDSAGMDINSVDGNGQSLLHLAVSEDHLDMLKWLVNKRGMSLNVVDGFGLTPLQLAARNGFIDIVKWLAKVRGMNATTGSSKSSPLHWAIQRGNLTMAKWLCEKKKMDLSLVDFRERTPLHLAALHGHVNLVKWLLQDEAVRSNNINALDEDKRTPLHLAAWYGQDSVVKILLELPEIQADLKDKRDKSAFLLACEGGHLAVVQLLVEAGKADLDIKFTDDKSLLHQAVKWKHSFPLLKWLVEVKGMDANITDHFGRSPLHAAARHGRLDLVKWYIQERSISPGITDKFKRAPLDLAKRVEADSVQKWIANFMK